MNRRISKLLTCILTFALLTGEFAPVLAEDVPEITSESADAEVNEATETGAEGLTVEFGEVTILDKPDGQQQEAAPQAAPAAPAAPAARYALIEGGSAAVLNAAGGSPFASIPAGSAVLVVESAESGARVAFNTASGIVTGFVAAESLRIMGDEETVAFLDNLIASSAVALYNDNMDTPLALVDCTFIEAAVPETPEKVETPENPETPEKVETPENPETPAEKIETPENPETIPEVKETTSETNETVPNAEEAGEEKGGTPEAGVPMLAAAGDPQVFPNVSDVFDINTRSSDVLVGDTCEIKAVAPNGEAIDTADLIFVSNNDEVATVDENGVVTANQSGSAEITISYQGEMLKSAINVPNEPDSIQLVPGAGTIGTSETYSKLQVQMLPEGTAAMVAWRSSNTKYVRVDANGVVRGVKKGSAYVYARTRNGKEARCKITVKKAPSKVSVSKKATMGVGQTLGLRASVPSGTASANITWSSANPAIASVDEHGVVTAYAVGTVKIYARTYNNKSAACTVTVRPAPEAIALNRDVVNLIVKGSATVGAVLTPANAMAANTFTSSDPTVATVNGAGKITARKLGVATITATTYNGITSAECVVNVLPNPSRVVLNTGKMTMGIGQNYTLTATVQPADADPTLRWYTSNKKIVRVSNGTITAVKAGTATITVKTSNNKSAKCKITVKKAPTGITLNPPTLRLCEGGMQFQLTGSVKPAKCGVGILNFESSDPNVATVSPGGLITTVNPGTAEITVSTYNGKTSRCALTVTQMPARAAFSETNITIPVKGAYVPGVDVEAADGSDAYTILQFQAMSNSGVISVDSKTGRVTGLKAGSAVVNVATHNSVTATTPLTINVLPLPTGIKLNAGSGTLGVGESYSLVSTVQGPEGCFTQLTWKTSNAKVVSIAPGENNDCLITAKGTGTANVTVSTHNGKSATCKVTVKKAPTSIGVKASAGSVYIGNDVTCSISRSSGSAGACTITSSDETVLAKVTDTKFHALKAGSAVLTATSYNGRTASVTVTVKDPYAGLSNADSAKLDAVIDRALSQLGKKYVYGAGYKTKSPSGFDCSGFTYWCYYYGANITLGNSAYKQGNDSKYAAKRVSGWKNCRRGDILCFKSDTSSSISHVGLYLGDGKFIHASSSGKKVQFGYFNSGNSAAYWTRNLVWGYHVLGD